MISETSAVVVFEDGVSGENNFDDYVVDVRPQLVHIVAVLAQPLVYGGDAPLGAGLLVADELLAAFLDGVVGQMHEDVLTVGLGGLLVRLGGEASKAFFVNENAKRIARGHCYVDS